jgi:Uma2 family endonuclease
MSVSGPGKIAEQLGPADQGRQMSLAEFLAGDYRPGFDYELIDGRLCASPLPDPPHSIVVEWLARRLTLYSTERPDIINYVAHGARVFVPGRRKASCPEPDLAAFHDFPLHLPFRQVRWQDNCPVLVAEVISPDNAEKDLVRNVELYMLVPGIREYWIFDTREDPDTPSLTVYRRHGARTVRHAVPFGERYSTRLLPGFELIVDPRR